MTGKTFLLICLLFRTGITTFGVSSEIAADRRRVGLVLRRLLRGITLSRKSYPRAFLLDNNFNDFNIIIVPIGP